MNLKSLNDNFHKYRTLCVVIFIFCMMATLSFLAIRGMQRSSAASTASFNPGNIISDVVMSNNSAMSRADIQNFLNAKGNCNNTNYSQYLQLKAAYPNTDWHFENGHFVCLAEERFGDGVVYGAALNPGEGQSAADIIYEAAQDYRINPQVLLVLLEKEQSLITDNYPNSNQFRSATGYGCPDTAACDSKYYGFKNQVRNAAAMFRTVLDGGWSNYPVGQMNYIQYNPSASCGGSMVYIENRATSALYRYTPYQPNAAALAAGYGTGDICSAYGNRNFYLLFTDWFGNTQVNINKSTISLPEGEYVFTTQVNSVKKALGTAGGAADDTNVQLVDFSETGSNTKWYLKKTGNDSYMIIHSATNKALDLNTINNNITIWAQHGGPNQQWKLYAADNGGLLFESVSMPGLVISFGSTSNIHTNLYGNTTNQQWGIYIGQILEDNIYNISSANKTDAFIDSNGVSNGNNISIWTRHGGANQEWSALYDKDTDTYSFMNSASGKYLDLSGAHAASGTNIQLWQSNNTCAQRWHLIPTGNNFVILSACSLGYAIDLYTGNTSNGTNIQSWLVHSESSQQWHLTKVEQKPESGQIYTIIPKNSSTSVLDVSSVHNVSSWERHDGNNQRWRLTYHPDSKNYSFTNIATNDILDISYGYTSSGTNVQVWSDLDICTQRWKLEPTSDGYYMIVSACSDDVVLDLHAGATYNGANIEIWERHNGDNQKFRLAR